MARSVPGGAHGRGTVYSITTSGTVNVVYSFGSPGSTDGWYPSASLIDAHGTLYGTTLAGGVKGCFSTNGGGCGTVFSVTTGTRSKFCTHSAEAARMAITRLRTDQRKWHALWDHGIRRHARGWNGLRDNSINSYRRPCCSSISHRLYRCGLCHPERSGKRENARRCDKVAQSKGNRCCSFWSFD